MTAISRHGCACGFVPDQSLELTDHFLEVFAPADDMDAGGQAHLELAPGLKCACGFTATGTKELDGHFHAVFPLPVDRIGRDGQRHAARDAA